MEHDNDLKMGTSCTGNLIISGNRSSDKKQLAINVIKALNDLDSDRIRKIAATSGDSINQRGIAKSMGKIAGAALIIEEAGVMERNRVEELLRVMKGDTDEMLVILEDSETEINNLLRNNPELEEYFNHRIVYKQYNVNELVEMCKRYAEKNNFMIDDKAMFLLYEQINAIHGHEEGVNLEEVRAVVDSAIDHAEKRAGRLLFGGVKKKKIDEKEYYILVESDFKG
jgi:hydrogenase maturation factor HypE